LEERDNTFTKTIFSRFVIKKFNFFLKKEKDWRCSTKTFRKILKKILEGISLTKRKNFPKK